jgi:glycosyltransferase involved in cell wall biosynthesis
LNSKKKILIFIDWYLPGFKAGGPIRSCAALVAQLKHAADFYIVTRNTDYCETEPYQNIQSNKWNILSEGENVYYLSKENLKAAQIKEIIGSKDFTQVYINGIYSFYFSILPLYFAKKKIKNVIVAPRGMLAQSAINVKGFKKNIFLFVCKHFGLYSKVIFHSTATEESNDILKYINKNSKVIFAPNLSLAKNEIHQTKIKKNGELNLINVARISPEKNLLYALEILLSVKIFVKFDIYGPIYDAIYWDQCLALIKKMPSNITVNYLGSIENYLLPEKFSNAHFMLMPTRGENFGHIIIESLAAGCPVIISDQTPWKNLNKKNIGWEFELSKKAEFIATINLCFEMDQEAYNFMSTNSFIFATGVLNNPENLKLNEALFNL